MASAMGQRALIIRVAGDPALRRVQLAFAAFSISEQASWLAVLVYALDRGGAGEMGLVAVAQLVPAVVLTPFSSYAGDRFAPHRALAFGYAVQCLAMAATAAAMWSGADLAAYASAAVAATAVSFIRPVMGALLPSVTHSPKDLVAVNVVAGLIEQLGVFVGPLLAGAVLAISTAPSVLATTAALTGIACLAVTGVGRNGGADDDGDAITRPDAGDAVHEAFAGFTVLRRMARLRILLTLSAVAGAVRGISDVAYVVFAQDRLGGGGGVAGVLAGCYGVGGLVGATAAMRMVRARGATGQLIVAGVLMTGALGVSAVVDGMVASLVTVAVLGAGESLLVITTMICLQRQAPTAVLSRVFGIVEGGQLAMMAAGSLSVSLLLREISLGSSFVVLAVAVALATLICTELLRRDGDVLAPVDELIVDRLLVDPVFAPLSAPTIERLARAAVPHTYDAGDAIIRAGEHGDRYYLLLSGTVEISAAGRRIRTLAAGQSFGEIALLHDVPRTADATALDRCELIGVDRDDFLEAVTRHSRALATAHGVAARLLDDDTR